MVKSVLVGLLIALGVLVGKQPYVDPVKLTWSPPKLTAPETIVVADQPVSDDHVVRIVLDPARDYILKVGHMNKVGTLEVEGGNDVVIMGGRITCLEIVDSNTARGRGIALWDNTGVFHVEGVLFENCGDGMVISSPASTVQLQNVRFQDIDAPYDLNHPDVIQTWRGPKEIRIDRLTADSSSKGFIWMSVDGTQPRRVNQRRVNFRLWSQGGSQPKGPEVFTWHTSAGTRSTCYLCWSETAWYNSSLRRRLQDSWGTFDLPDGTHQFVPYRIVGANGRAVEIKTRAAHDALHGDLGRRPGDYIERLAPSLEGERWYWGVPPGGDFVPANVPGVKYRSPGYG